MLEDPGAASRVPLGLRGLFSVMFFGLFQGTIYESKGAFHLSELAGQTGRSVRK